MAHKVGAWKKKRKARSPAPPPYSGHVTRRGPHPPTWEEFEQTFQQGFRIADDSLETYQLFVGEDAPVDFATDLRASSATLPFTWTPTPPGPGLTKVLHCVVQWRNKYDISSLNTYETILVIDNTGVRVPGPISAPQTIQVFDDLLSYISVQALYLGSVDNPDPAETWEVYVKENVDPVPGVDSPAFTGTMQFMGNSAALNQVLGPYAQGSTQHVLVVAKRTSPLARGYTSPAVVHTLATALALTDAEGFSGTTGGTGGPG